MTNPTDAEIELKVRKTAMLLALGVLGLMSVANIVLAGIINQREAQELVQSEQYGRLETVIAVREDFNRIRHYASQVNVSRLIHDEALEEKLKVQLAASEKSLEESLARMATFNARAVAEMKVAREKADATMQLAVKAISEKSPDAAEAARAPMQQLERIEEILRDESDIARAEAKKTASDQMRSARAGVRTAAILVLAAALAAGLFSYFAATRLVRQVLRDRASAQTLR